MDIEEFTDTSIAYLIIGLYSIAIIIASPLILIGWITTIIVNKVGEKNNGRY